MTSQASLTTSLATELIQVDPNFLLAADYYSFIYTRALYTRVHNKQEIFEFVNKRKFERFCELFEIPEYLEKPELEIKSLANNSALIRINSFTVPDKFYEFTFPYVRKGDDPRLIIGTYYSCTCEREVYSRLRPNLNFEKHKIYGGTFLADSEAKAHDFGVLGFPRRMLEAEGKTMHYVASNYEKKIPPHEFNTRFYKKNKFLKRVFMEDFWAGAMIS